MSTVDQSWWIISANLDCSLSNKTLQFHTVLGASFLDFLLFSVVYRQIIINHSGGEPRSLLVRRYITSAIITVLAPIFLAVGWKVSEIERLLPTVSRHQGSRLMTVLIKGQIFLTLITLRSSARAIHNTGALVVQACKKVRKRKPNAVVRAATNGNDDLNCQSSSSMSTLRKPLTVVTDNPAESYSCGQMEEGRDADIGIDNGCAEENAISYFGEMSSA